MYFAAAAAAAAAQLPIVSNKMADWLDGCRLSANVCRRLHVQSQYNVLTGNSFYISFY